MDQPIRPYIGGQAVIEGVMMRSPKSFVVAVRKPDGQIAVREQAWNVLLAKLPFMRWPIFRGALVLAESLHNGYSALKFSADHALPPDEKGAKVKPSVTSLLTFMLGAIVAGADADPSAPTPGEPEVAKKGEAGANAMLGFATLFMVGLFIALPHGLTWLIGRAIGPTFVQNGVWFHVIDGILRVAILVGYIWAISKTNDAKRLFRYHGAEHKAIWTYEFEKPLTVENATPFTTRHPRCGTSFLFIVVGVAVTLHVVLLSWLPPLSPNPLTNTLLMLAIKIPMAFPIAGIAYELQRWSAKPSCPAVITAMTKPGIWLQSITTIEPEPNQLEIALLSLDRAVARETGKAKAGDGVHVYQSFAQAAA